MPYARHDTRHAPGTQLRATPTADPARRARRRRQLQDALQQDAEAEGAELQGEGQREREVAVRLQEVEEAREGRRRGQGVEAAVVKVGHVFKLTREHARSWRAMPSIPHVDPVHEGVL